MFFRKKVTAQEKYEHASALLEEYIVSHHLRHTQERLIILQNVCQYAKQFTANDIKEAIKDHFISDATIYNALQVFEEAQIIIRLNRQYGQKRGEYELLTKGMNHFQLICTKCGRIAEFRDTALENILENKKFTNFKMERASLYVYGECKHCRRLPIKK